jgi:hypothetical protein
VPSPGRHRHSTLPLTAIGGHSLGIHARILLPLLPLSGGMAVPPSAGRAGRHGDLAEQHLRCRRGSSVIRCHHYIADRDSPCKENVRGVFAPILSYRHGLDLAEQHLLRVVVVLGLGAAGRALGVCPRAAVSYR